MRRAASRLTRIHVASGVAPGATLDLDSAAAVHVARVLRAAAGDELVLFADGFEFSAVILRVDKNRVVVRVAEGREVSRESALRCELVQGVSSGERMDYTLQKAVELGVSAMQPVFSERSVVRLSAERADKRLAHWQQIVISACEQCGRNSVPRVEPPMTFTEWLAGLEEPAAESRIMLLPGANSRLADLARPARVVLLAGPEGGLSEPEIELARTRHFAAVSLGPRILRTETAALAALAAMNALWGDF